MSSARSPQFAFDLLFEWSEGRLRLRFLNENRPFTLVELVGTVGHWHHVDMATRDLGRLGDKVKSHRLALYPSRQAAAASAGITKDTWQRVEEGHPVREKTYSQIEKALGWAARDCIAVAEGGEPVLVAPGAPPTQTAHPTEDVVRKAALEAATAKLPETPIGQVQEFVDELVQALRKTGGVQTDD